MCSFRQALLSGALCVVMSGALAEEKILDFAAEVRVEADASLLVTERITVQAEGQQIRRGIYREFPTRYRDRAGNRRQVGFRLLQVLRDGEPEPHHVEDRGNGLRIYIGSAADELRPGRYQYTLSYSTTRQLGHFAGFDELYWNVTGTGWVFPIEHASVRIHLPGTVDSQELRLAHYTGPQGADGQSARSRIVDGATVEFESTAALAAHEGLSVAVGWPQGLVERPSALQRAAWFLSDNGAALAMLVGWLLALAWYLRSWLKVGRDPRGGTIIPRFEPPKGLSPAACSYVRGMGLRNEAFVAALVSLGVKGCVRIDETDGQFTLYRLLRNPPASLSRGELTVLGHLLPRADSSISMEQEHHSQFSGALAALEEALASEYKGRLFRLNGLYMIPAVLITVLAGLVAVPLTTGPLPWFVYLPAVVVLHIIFLFALRAPTPAGRQVMDEIEGFRIYLGTAERERLQQMRSPRLTPEVFEAFLPYAFALGVENGWCQRFAEELPQQPRQASGNWQPGWYSGPASGLGAMSRLGSGFAGAMSSAIAAASTPPGSSSGSGGGGFSGGGGGGGGGGGW